MKNRQLFFQEKLNRVEIHLLRSYLRAKKSQKVLAEPDTAKVWDNYNKVKKLMDDAKK